ncbi:fibronectin type III domain-containing protein [Lactococcus cremoris]|uniref:fibronectin type III domain-containing protein n=1 Tax=Lactococcus lactis subsp. cremoris TaxID=1359 RepID=UPI002FC58847
MADKNYLHTAYANSADGTDRFTTVYPNLNLLDGTKDFKPISAGNGTKNQNAGIIYFTQNKTASNLFKAGDYITISYDIEFLNTELYSSSEDVNITIQMYGGSYTWISRISAKNVGGKFYTNDLFKSSGYVETPTHKVKVSRTIQLTQDFINANATCNAIQLVYNSIPFNANTKLTNLKIEPAKDLNSTATSWMPSSSEVTTADWPKYVGTYVDTNPVSSTVSSKYDWDEMKYRVYLDGTPVGGSKLLSFDLENLKAGTSYNVQVSQINGNVESDKSESVAFKTTLLK